MEIEVGPQKGRAHKVHGLKSTVIERRIQIK